MSNPLKALAKRKISHDAPISPPPLRRKLQSNTTQNAVASFFTPASQKPPEKITWQERARNDDTPNTLLVGKFEPSTDKMQDKKPTSEKVKHKIAAFDFDSTLIQTSSGKRFASDAQDWRWWHASVPGRLRELYSGGFKVVVVSNQGGISLKPDTKAPKAHMSKLASFKAKVAVVFAQLDIPVSIYAATEKDLYRKPRTGMWTEILDDYSIDPGDLDMNESFFVGDAAGREAFKGQPKDFSCSDRNFAHNLGLKFRSPEEYFLEEPPRPFTRTFEPADYVTQSAVDAPEVFAKRNGLDIVMFCGSPGAGKSTFYWKNLEPLGYTRINQDILKSRERCLKVAAECLSEGKSVAIDNTNADPETRKTWLNLAAKYAVPIRCVLFTTDAQICEHNDVVRALNEVMNPEKRTVLPSIAFSSFAKRFTRPQLSEGFQDITEVAFKFTGNEVEQRIWSRHWT